MPSLKDILCGNKFLKMELDAIRSIEIRNMQQLRAHPALKSLLPLKTYPKDSHYNTKVLIGFLLAYFPELVDIHHCIVPLRPHFASTKVLESKKYDEREIANFIAPHIIKTFPNFKFSRFIQNNLQLLQKCFKLSVLEIQILYAIYLIGEGKGESFFERNIEIKELAKIFAKMFHSSLAKVNSCLAKDSKLRFFGLISDYSSRYLCLSATNFTQEIMQESYTESLLLKKIANKLALSQLELTDFSYMKEDMDLLINFCKTCKNPKIFLYGEAGVGKNEIASLLAKILQKELWEVHSIDSDGEGSNDEDINKIKQFYRAQKLLNAKEHIILLDECEDVFENFSSLARIFRGTTKSKNAHNRMLENIKVPSIFLSNSASIDPALLRRFDIVLEIKAPPKEKKKQMIESALKSQNIELDSFILEQIAESHLSQGILLQGCKVANHIAKSKRASENTRKRATKETLIKTLNEHLRLKGCKEISPKEPHKLPYDMNLIHTDSDIVALSENLKSALAKENAQGARILAYGLPGSGKSEYAKELARLLEMPFIIKKGSDLLSMYVGGTEKNIAQAFSEAKREKAVLIFDEVDSFLQERAEAVRSWEKTQVNEMLTQMESFEGIFIATTNYFEGLDSASLRRFDIKLEFKPLDFVRLTQAFKLYGEYLGLNDVEQFIKNSQNQLQNLRNICFGDFALIAREVRFNPLKNCAALYEKLKAESGLKDSKNSKKMGF